MGKFITWMLAFKKGNHTGKSFPSQEMKLMLRWTGRGKILKTYSEISFYLNHENVILLFPKEDKYTQINEEGDPFT